MSRYLSLLNSAKYYREARAVLQAAVDRSPQNVTLKGDLIRVTAELDGLDAAILKARGFAKDDPKTDVYDLIAAQLYEGAGRVADAIALLEKAAAARPESDNLAVAIARLYIRTGDFSKAEAVLQTRLKADPRSVAVRSTLAPLYLATGRVDDARKIYDDLLAQNPKDVTGLLGLADIAISEKKWSEAADDINKARAAAPGDPLPGLKLASLYAFRQDWKNAIATTNELVAKFPTNIDVLDAQARAQIASGDIPGAIETYKHAYEVAPKSPQTLGRYLSILGSAKKFPEQRTVLQQALAADPQNAAIKADLIRVEYEISGLDAALAKARDFARADPDNSLYDEVEAELFDKANRRPEALALLEKAVSAKPADDRLIIALARQYAAANDTAKAEALLSRRLKDDADNFTVRSALAAIYLGSKNNDAAIAEYDKADQGPARRPRRPQ